MKDAQGFIENLQALIDAKKLLDRIVAYHHPYSGEFELPQWEKDYGNCGSLCSHIRHYIKFDDSE